MVCRRLDLPGGGFAIVCGPDRRRKCRACGAKADPIILCDWKLTGAKAGKTCDAPSCRSCATSVGDDKDLCPPHARALASDPRNPNATRTT